MNTNWPDIITKIAIAAAIALGGIWIASSVGCAGLNDGIRKMIGAPTSADVAAAEEAMEAAEQQTADAEAKVVELTTAIDQADAEADRIEQRKAFIRSSIQEAAAELANLEGEAADAMMSVLDELRDQLRVADADADQVADLVNTFRAKANEYQGISDQARREVERQRLFLEGVDEATADAIEKAAGVPALIGKVASDFGVIGGEAAGDQVSDWMTKGLVALLGGGSLFGAAATRRQRKKTNVERERADDFEAVIVVNEKLDLIKDDDDLKTAARIELGPDRVKRLRELKAKTRPVELAKPKAA